MEPHMVWKSCIKRNTLLLSRVEMKTATHVGHSLVDKDAGKIYSLLLVKFY